MRYLILLMLFAIAGCAEKNIPNPTTNCESAYEFKYSADDHLPVICYTVNNKECCYWELESGSQMEMCLSDHCTWLTTHITNASI